MNISDIYDQFIKGHPVTTDSRNIKKGAVFIALKGENFDGNRFAASALENGAILAVIDDKSYRADDRYLVVPDTLIFLQQVAAYHRRQLKIPILGITGTNGKTTTKELCQAVLSKRFRTFATRGNYNNHIGVPLTLLEMNTDTEFGIVEMGANHPGEIKTLCDIADPDFGILTNIGQAHLEGFGSYENIVSTKKQLYDHIRKKAGKLFVNADDPLLMKLSEGQERITYGRCGQEIKGEIKQAIPYLVYALHTLQGDLYIRTRLTGGYNLDNALAASCVGKYFGVGPLDIQQAIEQYRPSNMRSQLIKTGKNLLILDAYNANPSSMSAALSHFSEMQAENKIAILGEMLELGAESRKAHQHLIDSLLPLHLRQVLLVGNNFEPCTYNHTFIRYFPDTDALIRYLQENPPVSSCIFIKGSRGNKLERITEYL